MCVYIDQPRRDDAIFSVYYFGSLCRYIFFYRLYFIVRNKEIEEKIKALRERLRTHEVGRKWQRHFGLKMNLDSREQLGVILFSSQEKGGMGYKVEVWTGSGRPSTEESELEKLEIGSNTIVVIDSPQTLAAIAE